MANKSNYRIRPNYRTELLSFFKITGTNVDAIQMGNHNISLYKEVDKKYTGCNLKTIWNCLTVHF